MKGLLDYAAYFVHRGSSLVLALYSIILYGLVAGCICGFGLVTLVSIIPVNP